MTRCSPRRLPSPLARPATPTTRPPWSPTSTASSPLPSPTRPRSRRQPTRSTSSAPTCSPRSATPSDDLTVDFLTDLTPVLDRAPSHARQLIDDIASPGRPVALDFIVKNKAGDDAHRRRRRREVDHGFLTPNANSAASLKADPAAAEGGLYGEWKSLGAVGRSSAPTTTPSRPRASSASPWRSRTTTGFDDDGYVTHDRQSPAGPAVGKAEVEFSTDNEPLNPKARRGQPRQGPGLDGPPERSHRPDGLLRPVREGPVRQPRQGRHRQVYDNNAVAHVDRRGRARSESNYTGEAPALAAWSPKTTEPGDLGQVGERHQHLDRR